MSGPCFSHFRQNCPICFPTGGTSQPQTSQPATVTSPPAIPAKAGGAPAGGTDTTPVISTTSPAPSAAGTDIPVETPSPSPLDTSPAPPQPTTSDDDKDNPKKGKRLAVEFRPIKRKKKTIIDCLIAQQIFRRDLLLTNKFFNSGDVLAWAVEPDDPVFRHIHDYVACGQEHGYGLKICTILRIMAKAKRLQDGAIDFEEDPQTRDKLRMMLWHGTRKQVITSILENGLRLPRHRGQMFGPGIYFADRISKCCRYTGNQMVEMKAFFLLCDVLIGNTFESKQPMAITAPPKSTAQDGKIIQHDSVMGIGINIPDESGNKLYDGSVWPLGATVTRPDSGNPWDPIYLNFNEFIVYNENQVRPKYLVKVEFTEKPFYENF